MFSSEDVYNDIGTDDCWTQRFGSLGFTSGRAHAGCTGVNRELPSTWKVQVQVSIAGWKLITFLSVSIGHASTNDGFFHLLYHFTRHKETKKQEYYKYE